MITGILQIYSIALSYACTGGEIRIGDERIGIALFRKELLAMIGAFFFNGMAGYQRVKKRISLFRAKNASEPLGFLLPAAEGAGNLDCNRSVRQIDCEIRYLGNHQYGNIARSE